MTRHFNGTRAILPEIGQFRHGALALWGGQLHTIPVVFPPDGNVWLGKATERKRRGISPSAIPCPFPFPSIPLLYERGSRGVNVEANPLLVEAFRKARPDDLTINVGVGPEQGTLPFYQFTKRSGLNTFSEAIVAVRADRHPVEEVVHLPVWTISKIVDEYCGGVYPDLLSLDLEGLDLAVLKTADFSTSRPRVVIAELQGEDATEARLLMADWGFRVLCRMVSNLLFVHEDWIRKVS